MRAFITALLFAVLSMTASSAFAADCLPWSAARGMIAKHSLVPPHVVYHHIKALARGQIIRAMLCRRGGHFVYKFVVLSRRGDVQIITVDARTGR